MKSETVGGVLGLLFYVYFTGVMAAMPYHLWSFAQGQGFWRWLIVGPFVAFFKGLVWPYDLIVLLF